MYAIVDIAGQQMKVEKDEKIFVHLLEGDAGAPVHFNRVLLIDNDKDILVGDPLLSDALITGKILSHVKGDKIKVFKKKRRKGFKVMKGHRQFFTEVQIEEILEKGGGKILKEIVTKSETKKTVKTGKATKPEKAEKPEADARAVTKKVKPSPVTDIEKASKAEDKVKKVTATPVSKTKTGVKATGEKSSTTGKPSEGKATKSASAASGKTGTKTTAESKTSTAKKTSAVKKTVSAKKTAATKKSDKKK
jgi:large subunit ribosomal protein L21